MNDVQFLPVLFSEMNTGRRGNPVAISFEDLPHRHPCPLLHPPGRGLQPALSAGSTRDCPAAAADQCDVVTSAGFRLEAQEFAVGKRMSL